MQFIILKDNISIDDLGGIGNKATKLPTLYDESDPRSFIYDVFGVDDLQLQSLEKTGFIKIIRTEIDKIKTIDHIIQQTKRVCMLQGGSLKLKIDVAGHLWEFTEPELLNSRALRMRLLRLKTQFPIKSEDWFRLLNVWLEMAEEVHEISEENEIEELVLEYLRSCTIYKERDKSLGKYTILYDNDIATNFVKKRKIATNPSNIIFCYSANIERIKDYDYSLRRIRWLMSDYLIGSSEEIRVSGVKKRFWAFLINKCEIDLNRQLAEDDDEELEDINTSPISIEKYVKEDETNELQDEIISNITQIINESKNITNAMHKEITGVDNRAIIDVLITRIKTKGYEEPVIESEIWQMVDKNSLQHQEENGFNYVSLKEKKEEKKKTNKDINKSIPEIIKETEQEFGDEILIEEILERAETEGIGRDKTEEVIDIMKRDGLLYSPSKGIVKFVR